MLLIFHKYRPRKIMHMIKILDFVRINWEAPGHSTAVMKDAK